MEDFMSEDLVTAKDAKVTKERPILMNGEMVRAILAERKTQTRRLVKNLANMDDYTFHENKDGTWELGAETGDGFGYKLRDIRCPYGQPGDRLWVRETWQVDAPRDGSWDDVVFYGCKDASLNFIPEKYRKPEYCLFKSNWDWDDCVIKWRPSIHMPRWASRIMLEIADVRVERVQEISEADAWEEGIGGELGPLDINGRVLFKSVWNALYARLYPKSSHSPKKIAKTWPQEEKRDMYSWESNPWVWVIEFKVIEPALTPSLTPSLSHRCAIGEGELS
jgi:hypothetical protein